MKISREIDGGILVRLPKKNANRMKKPSTALKDIPQVQLTTSMTVLKLAKILMLKIPTGAVSSPLLSLKTKIGTSNAYDDLNFTVNLVYATIPML